MESTMGNVKPLINENETTEAPADLSIPDELKGQPMNLYLKPGKQGQALSVTIDNSADAIWEGQNGLFFIKASGTIGAQTIRGIEFSCQSTPGQFTVQAQGNPQNPKGTQIVYNETAWPIFQKAYCSTNEQGRSVPKVNNPALASNQQGGSETSAA